MKKLKTEELYYLMYLGRKFENTAKEYYLKGDISGFLHLDIGQEGFSVAAMKAFEKGDVFTTYREHVLAIARGMEPKIVMAELFGKESGISKGRGGSMHLFEPKLDFYGGDAIVGGQIVNAVGCAYARKYQESENAVMVIFGDGASNSGAFFESLNISSAWKLPLLFLCENNEYAIGTKITRVSHFEKQSNKAKPYMRTIEVDGMDVLAVYEAVEEANKYILEGNGPCFVEAMTCRYEGHSVADSNSYRSAEEMKICKERDPLEKLKKSLIEDFEVSESLVANLENKAKEIVDEAVEFALNAKEPDISSLFDNVFCKECGNAVS